jgi:hypothetical protein
MGAAKGRLEAPRRVRVMTVALGTMIRRSRSAPIVIPSLRRHDGLRAGSSRARPGLARSLTWIGTASLGPIVGELATEKV